MKLAKPDSSTKPWTIFATKNILLVTRDQMEVMNNYNVSISDFALLNRS